MLHCRLVDLSILDSDVDRDYDALSLSVPITALHIHCSHQSLKHFTIIGSFRSRTIHRPPADDEIIMEDMMECLCDQVSEESLHQPGHSVN